MKFISVNTHTDGRNKRALLAFTDRRVAHDYIVLQKSLDATYNVVIEDVALTTLARRCALNALDLCVHDSSHNQLTFDAIEAPNDDYTFHLENVILYYS